MVAVYRAAVAAGITPVEFWDMTPYLTKQAIRAANEEQITQQWILASLTRMKKLPKLETLLSEGKPHRKVDLSMKFHRIFVAHNAALKAKEGK